jgi:MoaA/NifB/PqqE/SkfB family radical SAM enzyme
MRFVARVAKNRAGAVPRPSWCTYLVSYRCNARCKMCDSWRMKPGDEMTPSDVAGVFEKLGPLDVVRLSGGEPFLREDLGEIAAAVTRASHPLVLHVTTNGSLPERVERFVASALEPRRLSIMVSLDGHRETHDANRGEQSSYDLAFETVRRLAPLRRRLGVDVSVNYTVISRPSIDDVPRVRQELSAMGVDLHVVIAYAGSATYGLKLRGRRAQHLIVPRGYPLNPGLEGADVAGLVERELTATRSLSSPLRRVGKRFYLRGLLARLGGDPLREPPCVALRSHVRLLPDGSVPVCQFNGEVVGNLRSQSLDEVWGGPRAAESRRWVDECTGCWAECEVVPSLIYSGRPGAVVAKRRGS